MNFVNYYFYSTTKKLRVGYLGSSGRNNSGKITVLHRCTGHKKCMYRVDFFRRIGSFGVIIKILKTPFFSSFLGYIFYIST
jgi:ribosomal protein L2